MKSCTGALFALACAALVASCSSSAADTPSSSAPSPTTGSGILEGYPAEFDQISPLLITSVAPDPIPFVGTDGKTHLAYELQVFNASPRAATLTGLQTLADGPDGKVLSSLSAEELAARTLQVGPEVVQTGPSVEIPGGRVGLVLLDGAYEDRAAIPARVTHRITATFAVTADDDRVAQLYPTESTQVGGVVTPSAATATVIGPPLAGEDWFTTGSCCTLAGHRGFMMPLGGRMNGTERFALEYVRLDMDAPKLIDEEAGVMATFRGDPTRNESYLAWDQPVLAVADGTVVEVISDVADRPPGSFAQGLELTKLTGNGVIIDLGGGVHAMVNHLKQGSVTVKVGDTVRKGQEIGRLGNSGNSAQPHLHFQMFLGVAPLSGDNLPFVIDEFTYGGQVGADGVTFPTPAGPRTKQYPLAESVTGYGS